MDENRDIQKDDPLSRFFDDHQVRTNPFGENRSGDRMYRRAERIAAGLHLITNHIGAGEPLRGSVRGGALVLLQKMLLLRSEMRTAGSAPIADFQASIRELISQVRLLAVSGFASTQNAYVLIEALDELGTFLSASQRSPLSEHVAFARENFVDSKIVREKFHGGLKDIKDSSSIKDNIAIKDGAQTSVKMTDSPLTPRKQSILEILQPGREMGIRDIAAHVPEFGEKTLQRELSQLILMGKVKKIGFKRWSRYSRLM